MDATRRGDWVQCESCGEETIFIGHDLLDFICSVCGCAAFIQREGQGLDFND